MRVVIYRKMELPPDSVLPISTMLLNFSLALTVDFYPVVSMVKCWIVPLVL